MRRHPLDQHLVLGVAAVAVVILEEHARRAGRVRIPSRETVALAGGRDRLRHAVGNRRQVLHRHLHERVKRVGVRKGHRVRQALVVEPVRARNAGTRPVFAVLEREVQVGVRDVVRIAVERVEVFLVGKVVEVMGNRLVQLVVRAVGGIVGRPVFRRVRFHVVFERAAGVCAAGELDERDIDVRHQLDRHQALKVHPVAHPGIAGIRISIRFPDDRKGVLHACAVQSGNGGDLCSAGRGDADARGVVDVFPGAAADLIPGTP